MLNEDYKDMLQILLDNEVKFLIVGAYALAAYGYPSRKVFYLIHILDKPAPLI